LAPRLAGRVTEQGEAAAAVLSRARVSANLSTKGCFLRLSNVTTKGMGGFFRKPEELKKVW